MVFYSAAQLVAVLQHHHCRSARRAEFHFVNPVERDAQSAEHFGLQHQLAVSNRSHQFRAIPQFGHDADGSIRRLCTRLTR